MHSHSPGAVNAPSCLSRLLMFTWRQWVKRTLIAFSFADSVEMLLDVTLDLDLNSLADRDDC